MSLVEVAGGRRCFGMRVRCGNGVGVKVRTRQLDTRSSGGVAAVLAKRWPKLHLLSRIALSTCSTQIHTKVMLGINYESSDEEEATPMTVPEVSPVNMSSKGAIATNIELPKPSTTLAPGPTITPSRTEKSSVLSESLNGPAQGPTATLPPAEEGPADDASPGSPYTSTRLTIQNLTLPTIPNWNIPRSPPGSPPQKATKKFSQFLDLKNKGTHFNQRLENSSVLRDPSHLRRLMDFAGINEEDQYASTLPEGLGVPVKWPDWAYGDELNASQKKIGKAREEARAKLPRESIDFVSARSATSSSTATPHAKGARQSAAGRVIGGLDKQQSSHSSSQSTGKRKELEHRGGKDSSRSRWRSMSRSPKRRRSRSTERK